MWIGKKVLGIIFVSVFIFWSLLNASGGLGDYYVTSFAHNGTVENKNNDIGHNNITSGYIPRILHQEWKSTELPQNFQTWRDECMRLNPDWEFKLWTDDDNLKLISEYYPELLELYNSYDANIKRIDMIRFLYLHKFGGVYMDLDITCLKPFGSIFENYPDKFVVVNQFEKKREYANAVMAAPKGLDLFDDIFRELPRHKKEDVLEATGGLFLQYHVLGKTINKGKWVEFPFELFYAQDWTEKLKCNSFDICRTKYPNAVTVSMWTGTWAGGSASKGEWRDSSNNSTITNYNITTEIANKIYLSGILDKELCYECIWKSGTGTACHRRMDYFIDRYRKDRKSAIDGVVNEYPPCRVTTINTTMSQDLGNKSKLLP